MKGDFFFVNSVFNASSSSLSNCTSTFFECEYTVSILNKYVAFLSQNVTSNVIDRTKKNGNRSCLAFLFLYCFFAQYIQSIICWTKVTFILLNQQNISTSIWWSKCQSRQDKTCVLFIIQIHRATYSIQKLNIVVLYAIEEGAWWLSVSVSRLCDAWGAKGISETLLQFPGLR